MPAERTRSALAVTISAVAVAVVAAVGAGSSDATGATVDRPAPKRLANPDTTATQLLSRFLGALAADDEVKLGSLLSPAWMIQRANGTWANRAQYLAAMPDVRQYQIVDVMAQYAMPTLVVRSRTATQEMTAGGALSTSPLAPRLSTFTWQDGRWRMTSHANFNPPG
ncbi:MAG: hypothetical protein KGQ95_03120 [Acidobacteria bacterium]|nr:hypothetical protein [Acidobacteriota bacterium]